MATAMRTPTGDRDLNIQNNSTSGARFEAVAVGDALPDLQVTPTLQNAVMYAAAMWEFQKIHFDHEWSRTREHLDGAIIQGPVLGNYLARALGRWAGPRGRIKRLAWRNHGTAPLGEALVCSGRVTARHENGLVDCELASTNPRAEKIVSATASVQLAREQV